jgi:hypothetical protein
MRSAEVLLQKRDVRLLKKLPCLDGEIEHPLDRGELTVDLAVRLSNALAILPVPSRYARLAF